MLTFFNEEFVVEVDDEGNTITPYLRRQNHKTAPHPTTLLNISKKTAQILLNVEVVDVEGDMNVTRPVDE